MDGMLPYWILFAAWALYALQSARRVKSATPLSTSNVAGNTSPIPLSAGMAKGRRPMTLGFALMSFATAIMIGVRYKVGGDWGNYLRLYQTVQLLQPLDGLKTTDPAYALLEVLSAQAGWGMLFINLACGLIMMAGVAKFAMQQRNPGLTVLVAVPYLIIVVGMGYSRQGVAIGLILAGLAGYDGKRTGRLVVYVLIAALFHKTALPMLPIIIAPLIRRNALYALAGALAFALIFRLVLQSSTDDLMTGYVESDFQSSGAIVRVAMNILPAVCVVYYRKRLGFSPFQSEMWTVFAFVALFTFPLALASSFTTAIDRMALYLIPLQLAVLPRVPYAFSRNRRANPQLIVAVIVYSAAVQLIWLVFATNSRYWVPYGIYSLSS